MMRRNSMGRGLFCRGQNLGRGMGFGRGDGFGRGLGFGRGDGLGRGIWYLGEESSSDVSGLELCEQRLKQRLEWVRGQLASPKK